MLDKQGYRRARACNRPRARAPTRTRTHSKCITLIAFPRQQWFAMRIIVALYIHCLPCFQRICPEYQRAKRGCRLSRGRCLKAADARTSKMALATWPVTLWTVLSFTAGFLWNLKYGPEHRVKWNASENCKTKAS